MPISFGPLPGPRQDGYGGDFKDQLKNTNVVRATINFKTDAESVRDLLPNDSYSFGDRDMVTFAFVVESFRDLAWLGGGGYDLLALYIHDVGFGSAELQKEVRGTFCPLMIENLADPIISGREELGVPKVFSDIRIFSSDQSYRVEVSWRGTLWATLEWNGLRTAVSTMSPNNTDLLVHKYIPATGSSTEPDADYPVMIRHQQGKSETRSEVAYDPSSCNVRFYEASARQLPTLHHVVRRLKGLEDSQATAANVVEYQGVPDLSNAQRV
jgi:hypothetical protein